jgi:hypothetical protein
MIDFIIIGAQKSGTTAAAYNLGLHPDINIFSGTTEYGQKEIEFFNQHYDRGVEWYLNHFTSNGKINGEKTSELFHRLICHQRIYNLNPEVKLILLLRSPIIRAYSQWNMASNNKKDEFRTFEEVITDEVDFLKNPTYRSNFYYCKNSGISTWREGYLLKGFYFEQLEHLLQYFPSKNVHIVIAERIINNMKEEYNKIFNFLKIQPRNLNFSLKFCGVYKEQIKKETILFLSDFYKESNISLFKLLGYEIPEWSNR